MTTDSIQLDHAYIKTNDMTLHVVQAGDPEGDLVILLHGFPDFWYGWLAQIRHLAALGYRVWAPDQRGYNVSDKPFGVAAYRMSELVADVVGLIDAADADRAYLVGHDWGAGVVWATAITHPDRLNKMAILNVPHPKVFYEALRANTRQMLKSWYFGFFQIPLLPETLLTVGDAMFAAQMLFASSHPRTFSDADIAEYTRAWKQPDAMKSMINWYRAVVQYPPDMTGDLRITVPTLILWGLQDVALTPEMAQQSVERCDDGRLVTFEGNTHWIQHEVPQQVNAHLTDFFADTAAP